MGVPFRNLGWITAVTILLSVPCRADTHYVWTNSPTPAAPFADWNAAAHDIQSAVNVAINGDTVLVTNGVYDTGGVAVYGAMTNRVVINKEITVRSVNGAPATIIVGKGPMGDGAVRCVYVGTNAILEGFTLTNGCTLVYPRDYSQEMSGGGVWCEDSGVVSNCTLLGNYASYEGGGSHQGTLNNCTLSRNSAGNSGGGAYGGTLNDCTLSRNSAAYDGGGANNSTLNNCALSDNSVVDVYSYGGGAAGGTLNNCTLSRNSAGNSGGGAYGGTLNNCTLSSNSAAWDGGGAFHGTLNNCTVLNNFATRYGGGTYEGTLNNCAISGNSAGNSVGGYYGVASGHGGGAAWGILNNCTLTANSADDGGGTFNATLTNCIIWYNLAPNAPNCSTSTLNYCCTTPLSDGAGNISRAPLLADASHLFSDSPCIGQGSPGVMGVDIDGDPWANPPSIGCDEYRAGTVTGDLSVTIIAACTQCVANFEADFTALIVGHASASRWSFGDGVTVSNEFYVSHHWSTPGPYQVVLTTFNESCPSGVCATTMMQVVTESVHYVALSNPTPVAPYASWATAATNIQDAANIGGGLVLVSNGVYDSGGVAVYGAMTNRVAINKGSTVRSVNGPEKTVIMGKGPCGDGAVRCVYLGANAVLEGFTLTRGHTRTSGDSIREQNGGGVWCENGGVVSNCTLSGNSASYGGGGSYNGTLYNCILSSNSAWGGGGAFRGILNNCIVSGGNSTSNYGGGVNSCTLNNCTLASNSGGGAWYGALNNCIIWYNSFNYGHCALSYCCSTPIAQGTGNISNEPAFVDYVNGDYHLSSSSMCISAGNNTYVTGSEDIDGGPRVQASIVDMGAYESPYGVIDSLATWRGTISPAGRVAVMASSNQSFTMTADSGYPPIRDVIVDGVSIGPTNSYTFLNLTSNHVIEAIFWVYPSTNWFGFVDFNRGKSNEVVLRLNGPDGGRYALQKSSSVLPPVWSNVPPYTNVSGSGSIMITNDLGSDQKMYFRLKAVEN